MKEFSIGKEVFYIKGEEKEKPKKIVLSISKETEMIFCENEKGMKVFIPKYTYSMRYVKTFGNGMPLGKERIKIIREEEYEELVKMIG